MDDETERELASLTVKVTILETATALLLAGVLGRHPDPLDGLAAFESVLDRTRRELSPNLPPSVHNAAAETVHALIREGQAALDLSQQYWAGRSTPPK